MYHSSSLAIYWLDGLLEILYKSVSFGRMRVPLVFAYLVHAKVDEKQRTAESAV